MKLIVLGFGGHARSVADVAWSLGCSDLLFVDPNAQPGEHFASAVVVPDWPSFELLSWDGCISASGQASVRHQHHSEATLRGLSVLSVISAEASCGTASQIGVGCFVGHHAHIGPAAKVGEGCIVNTAAILEHESVLGPFTHLSVNAVVAGRSRIGARCFIGAGAIVIDSLTLCDDVVVGAGATVVENIEVPGTYVGCPARRLV